MHFGFTQFKVNYTRRIQLLVVQNAFKGERELGNTPIAKDENIKGKNYN